MISIAYGALLLWPLVSLGLYLSLPASRATVWTLLAGYLLLPIMVGFDFPGVPMLDKSTIPSLTALVLAPLMARKGEFRWPRSTAINLLTLLYLLVPFATAWTNTESITIGSVTLPALGFREGLSASIGNLLSIVPFLLGAAMLSDERSHRYLLRAFVIAALVYSIPVLFEIRMSPILQGRLYAVAQVGNFIQQIRFGGFRSMVFLGHGLLVSTFLAMALVAAIGLARMKVRLFSLPAGVFAGYLAVVLVLNKSLTGVGLALLMTPLLYFLRSRQFLTVCLGLALLIVTYPFVRGTEILPLQRVVEVIKPVAPERAESLQFRLDNEDMLLHRAGRKPWFGWGSYGRNRVIVVTSWGATQDVSVTDGTWVITIGVSGWLGYIGAFGLLTYPFLRAFRMRRMALPMATLTLIAMHLLNLLDLIPNSSLRPITWMIAGALASMTAASLGIARGEARAVVRRDSLGRLPEPAVQT